MLTVLAELWQFETYRVRVDSDERHQREDVSATERAGRRPTAAADLALYFIRLTIVYDLPAPMQLAVKTIQRSVGVKQVTPETMSVTVDFKGKSATIWSYRFCLVSE